MKVKLNLKSVTLEYSIDIEDEIKGISTKHNVRVSYFPDTREGHYMFINNDGNPLTMLTITPCMISCLEEITNHLSKERIFDYVDRWANKSIKVELQQK